MHLLNEAAALSLCVTMRLLIRSDTDTFSLTKEFIGDDIIPPYAILSHTWREGEEVTFKHLMNGTGQDKSGYNKIRVCGQQAKRDGLQYYWVDTRCTIQSHHRYLCPTKVAAYAAKDGGRMDREPRIRHEA